MQKLIKRESSASDKALFESVKWWLTSHGVKVTEAEKYGSPTVILTLTEKCYYDDVLAFVKLFGTKD